MLILLEFILVAWSKNKVLQQVINFICHLKERKVNLFQGYKIRMVDAQNYRNYRRDLAILLILVSTITW